MILSEDRGLKSVRYSVNQQLVNTDLLRMSQFEYENFTDILAMLGNFGVEDGTGPDRIISGLLLEWDSGLSSTLRAGSAVSYTGEYILGGSWNYSPETGKPFIVVLSEDTTVVVDAGGAQARYDTIEVRPIQTNYDTQARVFKDPVTGSTTTGNTSTKTEYNAEFQILKGTEGAGVAPVHTAGWIKIAEVYVAASAPSIDQDDIKDVRDSIGWTTEAEGTKYKRGVADVWEDLIVYGDILPGTDSTYTIGAVGSEWLGGYFDTVYATTVAATGSVYGSRLGAKEDTHYGWIDFASDLTADHTLTIDMDNADRTLAIHGTLTVESASTVNQDLTSDASPTFSNLTIGNGAAATPSLRFSGFTTTGLYAATGILGLSVAGASILTLSATLLSPVTTNTVSLGDGTHYFSNGYLTSLTVTNTITGSVSGQAGSVAYSLSKGNGMATMTAYNGSAARTMTLGTPSTCTESTTNAVTTDSHTHVVTFDAGSLGGTTLKSTVVSSSLTSVGTLNGLIVSQTTGTLAGAIIARPVDISVGGPVLIVAGDGESDDYLAEFRANATATAVDVSPTGGSTDAKVTIMGNGDLKITGALFTSGTSRLTSGGALQNITGITVSSGAVSFSSASSVTIPSTADSDSTYTGIVVNESGTLKYRTKSNILSDIGAEPALTKYNLTGGTGIDVSAGTGAILGATCDITLDAYECSTKATPTTSDYIVITDSAASNATAKTLVSSMASVIHVTTYALTGGTGITLTGAFTGHGAAGTLSVDLYECTTETTLATNDYVIITDTTESNATNKILVSNFAAPAGMLSGTTLKSTVVTSSLTSVGTLTSLNVSGAVTMSNSSITIAGITADDSTYDGFLTRDSDDTIKYRTINLLAQDIRTGIPTQGRYIYVQSSTPSSPTPSEGDLWIDTT